MVIIPPFPPSKFTRPHEHMIQHQILDRIGYDGWAALSWALHDGWIQEYKLRFSHVDGYDVEVPETVRRMIDPAYMGSDSDSKSITHSPQAAGYV